MMLERDPLTGLYRYEALVEVLKEKFGEGSGEFKLVLFCIEFDDLARFNDTFDIDLDEQLLIQLADTFRKLTSDRDIVARAGTYRFVWLSEGTSSKEEAYNKAQAILNTLQEPFCIAGNMFYITASIGISLSSNENNSAIKMLKSAENTMRMAQKKGTNHIEIGSNEPNPSLKTELRLMKDLPSAIDNGEIYFVYQGQYSLKEKRFVGAEILTRWLHPELGHISPGEFIPLAEKSGMISPLTTKILVASSCMFRELEAHGIKDFSLSVNISPYVLLEKSFCDTVAFLIENYGLADSQLNFEIMEDTISQNLENFTHLLSKIKQRNIGIEIDDYGTGNTSLNYLISLPIDTIKIDRSFVSDIDKHPKKYALLCAIIDMAKALELDVIIEGVETEMEIALLRKFENIVVQGYYFTKPLSESEFIALLTEK